MPIPAQQPGTHRVLLRAPSELPPDYEVGGYTDGQGVRRFTGMWPDEEGDVWSNGVAFDFPAARFSPRDCWEYCLNSYGGRNPYSFEVAPAIASKSAPIVTGIDGSDDRGAFLIEKGDDGRVFVSGPCYVAGELDTDGEFMTQAELKSFAHSLMLEGSRKGDTDHDRQDRVGVSLVESTMARKSSEGFVIDPDGETWWVKYEVIDPVAKARIELPEDDPNSLNAFSWDGLVRKRVSAVSKSSDGWVPLGGLEDAVRQEAIKSLDLEGADKGEGDGVEMFGGRCVRVSLVHRGANSAQGVEGFAVATKSADADALLGSVDPTPSDEPGRLGLLGRWLKGRDEPTVYAESKSMDDAAAQFQADVEAALTRGDKALSTIESLGAALGVEASRRAKSALSGTIAANGTWFTPPTEGYEMTKEEIQEAVKAAVTAALAEKGEDDPTPDPAADDAPALDAEAVKAIATDAVAAYKAEAEAKHAEAIKAKDEALTEAKAEIDRLKAAPKGLPSAGHGDDTRTGGDETPARKSLAERNAERREANNQKFRGQAGGSPVLLG